MEAIAFMAGLYTRISEKLGIDLIGVVLGQHCWIGKPTRWFCTSYGSQVFQRRRLKRSCCFYNKALGHRSIVLHDELPRLEAALLSVSMPDLKMELAAGGRVAGVDEAGRGPLAGPVVAAAVVLAADMTPQLAGMLDDSKKLTAAQRLAAFAALQASSAEIGVGAASVAEILRLNILHASMLAMRRAVSRLLVVPDLALVDGNYPPRLDCAVRCVVGGDALCLSIAAASIVAKVVRDRAMARLAVRCPGYGWQANAGYATASHRAALRRLGPTRHHRAAFGSVAQLMLELTIAD